MPATVILVEGPDDVHVVGNLVRHHGIETARDQIKDKQGYENLIKDLSIEVRASDLEAIAIVVDADVDLNARWQSLRAAIQRLGYACNDSTMPDGLIVDGSDGLPRLGVWIMPDNTIHGKIEDFVAKLVPADDSLWVHAHSSTEAIPADTRRFREVDLPKAKIHAWLAWQAEPGMKMGQAINRRVLAADSELAVRFVDWLRRLGFNAGSQPSNPWR